MREETDRGETKPSVSYVESLPVIGRKAAAAALTFDQNLRFANEDGVPMDELVECFEFGLLAEDKQVPKRNFFLWTFYRRAHIVTISLRNDPGQKSAGKRWLMNVYGRSNVERLTKLAEYLSARFDVEVHVRLESEDDRFEQRHTIYYQGD